MRLVGIRSEMGGYDPEKLRGIAARLEAKGRSGQSLDHAAALISDAEGIATPPVRRILEEVVWQQREFEEMVARSVDALRSRTDAERRNAYGAYLIQTWYHEKFVKEFQRRFAERLEEYLESSANPLHLGRKFLRAFTEDEDTAVAKELWVLQDLGDDSDVEEVLDDLEVSCCLYSRMFARCFCEEAFAAP